MRDRIEVRIGVESPHGGTDYVSGRGETLRNAINAAAIEAERRTVDVPGFPLVLERLALSRRDPDIDFRIRVLTDEGLEDRRRIDGLTEVAARLEQIVRLLQGNSAELERRIEDHRDAACRETGALEARIEALEAHDGIRTLRARLEALEARVGRFHPRPAPPLP